jgi:hypothetical protein
MMIIGMALLFTIAAWVLFRMYTRDRNELQRLLKQVEAQKKAERERKAPHDRNG